jgi:hypothetical protein
MQDLIEVERFVRSARGSLQGTGVVELRGNILQSVAQLGPQAFDAVMDRLIARLGGGVAQQAGDIPAVAQWMGNVLGTRLGVEGQATGQPAERFFGMVPQGSKYARPAPVSPAARPFTYQAITPEAPTRSVGTTLPSTPAFIQLRGGMGDLMTLPMSPDGTVQFGRQRRSVNDLIAEYGGASFLDANRRPIAGR